MTKLIFSAAITPVFSVTWSFRNPSSTLIGAGETFLIVNAERVFAAE